VVRQVGVCYVSRNAQAWSLDCDGASEAAGGRASRVALMNRPDFAVAFVDLPRAAQESPREYLGYRVRGLYPAPAEETAFDYRLLGSGRSARAVVFATRTELLDRYRALGQPLALPYSLAEAAVPGLVAEGGAFLFVHPDWIETLVIPGKKVKVEPRSLVAQRGATLASDLEAALAALGDDGMPVRVLAAGGELERVRAALAAAAPGGRTVTLHGVEAARPERAALFGALPRRRLPGRAVRLQALLLLILALAVGLIVRSAVAERARLADLQARLESLRSRAAGVATDRKRADALAREWVGLQAQRPVDVYRLLSELSRALGGEIRVSSLIVDGRLFQVEAEARGALELVGRLREDPWFEGVRLLQTVPAAAGNERFRLTGSFRAQ
jgi:hypothetical protein